MTEGKDRRWTLLCTLCGQAVPEGEEYWYRNGEQVCPDCLADYARGELAPFRQIRGKEMGG